MEENLNYMQIAGTIRAVLFHNEENGYAVVKLETQDGSWITAVGCLPGAAVGEQLILTGKYVLNSTYGEQFKAEWAERSLPVGVDAIYDYLASGAIKGIGPATATLLVSQFGEKTLGVIENQPERVYEIKGISRKKALGFSSTLKKQIGMRRVLEYLSNYGLKPTIGIRLYRAFGDRALERLEENPYIISRESIGASFAEADKLALDIGFEGDAPERVAAATVFELSHNSKNGHCFIPYSDLITVTSELIDVSAEQIEEAIEMLILDGDIVRCQIAGKDACYLVSLYESEAYVAERIKQMVSVNIDYEGNIEELIEEIEKEQAVDYADLQIYSLRVAALNQIMLLTGGPGTGKTTTVRAIVSLFKKLGLATLITAPTGRSAKRISELCGYEASTIHRLLEAGYTEDEENIVFRRNEKNLLECDAIILDECSMVDITLMHALISAMPESCRLVLVGDADQLPSVGPGNVFGDSIRSGVVQTVRLTDIFRQTESSSIVTNAHIINRGEYPNLINRVNSDFFLLKRNKSSETVDTLVDLCTSRLPANMGISKSDIQVLSPTRRGECGTTQLNLVLQNAINPPDKEKKEKKFGEIVFREGDRVMQIRNNYDIIWYNFSHGSCFSYLNGAEFKDDINTEHFEADESKSVGSGIYNGDIGEIISIDSIKEIIHVLYDDKLAAYGFDMLTELEHAFAITVHKSQGSEYDAVLFVAADSAPQLLSRKVLYTAVTRAKNLLIIVGPEENVYRMIDNHKISKRYSGLRARLQK